MTAKSLVVRCKSFEVENFCGIQYTELDSDLLENFMVKRHSCIAKAQFTGYFTGKILI